MNHNIKLYCDKLLQDESYILKLMSILGDQKRGKKLSLSDLEQILIFTKKHQLKLAQAGMLHVVAWFSGEDGIYDIAIDYLLESYQIYESLNAVDGMVSVCNALMCVYFHTGLYTESQEWGVKGIKLSEGLEDPKYVAHLLGNTVIHYLRLEKYKEAREVQERVNYLNINTTKMNELVFLQTEAELCLVEGNLKKSKVILDDVIKRSYELGYPIAFADSFRLKARLLHSMGDEVGSDLNFQKSEEIAIQYQLKQEKMKTYLEWAKICLQQKRYEKAEDYLLKAYQQANRKVDPLFFSQLCGTLIELYKAIHDFEKALNYYEIKYEHEKTLELARTELWGKKLTQEMSAYELRIIKTLYDELQIISSIGQSLTTNLSYKQLLLRIHDELANLISSNVMAITELNQEEESLKYAIYMQDGDYVDSGHIQLDDENSLGVYCIKHKKSLIIHDLLTEYKHYHLEKDKTILLQKGIQSLLCCPLLIQDEVKGYITIQSYEKNQYSERDLSKLSILASYIAIALENAKLYKKANYLARYDGLTGLNNRVQVLKKGEQMLKSAHNDRCCVLMLDIDYFKKINDTFGHLVGDEVIQKVGLLLTKKVNSNIHIGRYGGEEFVIFLQGYTESKALVFAEKIREELLTLSVKRIKEHFPSITASFGVYEYEQGSLSAEEGIHFADLAMYYSKTTGRNKVTPYSMLENKETIA